MGNMSIFPNGFANGALIKGLPVRTPVGQVFYVGNSTTLGPGEVAGSNGNDGTFYRPFATLDHAIGLCKANHGDVIYVKPGHAETVSSATAINLDVAGITIIGLGVGNERPTFTLDTATTATLPVSAANISVANCIFSANFADIVSFFTLGAAKCFGLYGNRFKATATNMNAKYVVDTNATTNDASGLKVIGNQWIEPDLLTETMIKMDGTNDDIEVSGNFLSLGVKNNTPAVMVIAAGKVVTNADMGRNRIYRLNTDSATGALFLTTDQSTNTGILWENYIQHADVAAELFITASAGFGEFQNFCSGVAGASGYLLPAADS